MSTKSIRREELLRILNTSGAHIDIGELANQFDVTEGTLSNDIKDLIRNKDIS